jgi:hypothetical protein
MFSYQKAAEQGYAKAQSNLGAMYDFGKGVLKDDKQSAYCSVRLTIAMLIRFFMFSPIGWI